MSKKDRVVSITPLLGCPSSQSQFFTPRDTQNSQQQPPLHYIYNNNLLRFFYLTTPTINVGPRVAPLDTKSEAILAHQRNSKLLEPTFLRPIGSKSSPSSLGQSPPDTSTNSAHRDDDVAQIQRVLTKRADSLKIRPLHSSIKHQAQRAAFYDLLQLQSQKTLPLPRFFEDKMHHHCNALLSSFTSALAPQALPPPTIPAAPHPIPSPQPITSPHSTSTPSQHLPSQNSDLSNPGQLTPYQLDHYFIDQSVFSPAFGSGNITLSSSIFPLLTQSNTLSEPQSILFNALDFNNTSRLHNRDHFRSTNSTHLNIPQINDLSLNHHPDLLPALHPSPPQSNPAQPPSPLNAPPPTIPIDIYNLFLYNYWSFIQYLLTQYSLQIYPRALTSSLTSIPPHLHYDFNRLYTHLHLQELSAYLTLNMRLKNKPLYSNLSSHPMLPQFQHCYSLQTLFSFYNSPLGISVPIPTQVTYIPYLSALVLYPHPRYLVNQQAYSALQHATIHDLPHLDELQPSPPSQCLIETRNEVDLAQPTETLPSPPQSTPHSSDTSFPHIPTTTSSSNLKSPFPPHTQYNNAPIAPAVQSSRPIYEYYERVQQQHRSIFSKTWATQKNNPISFPNIPKKFSIPLHQVTNTHIDLTQSWYSILWVPVTQSSDALHHYAGNFLTFHSFELLGPSPLLSPTYFGNHIHPNHDPHAYLLQYQLLAQKQSQNKLLRSSICSTCYPHSGPFSPQSSSTTQLNSTSVSNNLPTTPRSQTPSQTLLQGVGNVPNTDPQNHQQQQPVTSLPINSQQNQNQNQNQPQFTFTNTNTNCAHSQQHIIEIPHLPFSNHNHNSQSSLTDPTSSLLPSFSHSTLSSALSHTQTYAPQQLHHDHQCQQCSYMFMSPELKYARLIHLIRANYAGFSANPDSAIFDSIIHNMTSPSRLQTDPTLSSLNLNDFDSVLQFLNAAYTERNFQTTAMPEFDFTPPNQQTSNTQTTQAGLTSSAVTPYNPANAPSPSHHTSSDQQPQYGQNANYPMEPELGSEKLGVLKGIFGATDRFLNSRTGALHQFYAQQHQQSQYGTQNVPQKPPHLPPHLLPLYQLSRPTTTFSTHNSLNHLQFPHFYPSNIAEPYRLFNFADSHLEKIDLAAPTCDASILFADSMVHKYAALAKLSEEIDTICGTNDHYDRCTAEQPQTSQQYSSPSPLTQSRQGHDASISSPIPSSSVSSSDSPSTSCSSSSSDFFSNSDLCFSTESEDEFSASGVENSESSSDVVDSELHHHPSNRNHHSGNSRNKCLVNSQHSTANTASNCNRTRIDPTVQQAVIQDMEQLLTVPCYIPVIGYVACGVKPFIWFNPLTPPRVPNNITVTNRLSVDQLQAFLPRTSQQLWVSLKNSRQSQNQESFGQKYDNKGSSSANSTSGAEKDLFPNIPFYHQPDYADVITSIIRTSRTRVHSQEISQLIQSLYAYCDASSRDHDDDGGDGNKTRPDHELFQLFDEISALLGLHKKAVTSESNSRHRGDGDEVYRFLCRNPTCKKEKVRVESRNQADSQQRQFHTLASLSSSVSSNPHQRRTHSQHFVYDNDCDEMEEEDMSDMFYDEPTPRSGQFMLSATDQLSQHSHKSHDKTESKSAAFSTSQDQLTQPDLDSPLVHLYLLTHPQMVILNTNDVDLTKREKIKKNQLLHQFPLFKSYQDERGRVPISELNPLLFNTLAHDPAQYTHIIPPPVLSPTSQLSNVAMTKQIRANSHHLSASKFPADGADPVASFSTSDLVLFLSDQVTSSLSPELSLYQVADLSNTLSSCSGSDDDSASTNAQSISQPSTFAPHSLPHGQSAISPLSANNHSTPSNFTKSHANSLLAGPTPVNISDRDTSRSSYMPSAKTLPSDGQLNKILTPYENSIKERVGRIVHNSPQPLQLILSTHSILDQISLQSQSALYNTNILQNATSLIQPISSPYGTKELVQYYFSNPPPAYSAPAQPGDKTRSTTQFNTNATPFTQPKPLNQAGFPASTAKGNPTTTAQPPTPTSNATNTAQLKLERSSSPASAVNTKATHTTTSSKIIPIALPQSDDVSNLPVDSPNPSSSHQPSTTTSIASTVHSSATLAIIPPSSPKSQTSSQTSIATGTSALNPPPSSNTSIIPTLNSRYAKYSAQMESHPFTTISFETLHTLSTMDYLQYINSTRSNYPFFSTIRPHFFPQSSHQKESESHPAGKPLSSKLLQLVTQAQQQQKARHELCVFPPAEWVPALASIENRIYWEILPSSQLHTTRPDANINTNTNSNMNTANGPQSPNPSSQTQNPLSNNSSANTNNNSNGMFRVNSTGHGGTGSSGTTTSTPFTPAPRLTYTAQQLQHFAQPLVNAQYFTPQQFILSSQQSQELLTQQQQPASSHFGPTSSLSSSSSSSSVLTPLNNLASPSPAIAPLSSSSYQPNNQLNNPANNSSYQYQSFPPYPKFIPTILPPAVLASDRLTNPPNVSTQPLNANLELHHYLASSYQHAYNTSGTARQPHYPIGLGYNDRIYSFDLHPFLQHNINGFPSIHPDFATAIKQSQQGDATAFPGR